ncbi:MAG: transglutaminase domain-containing protein [Acidimicrobiales bacterium]|nr:transglutaminase domain-containing protein [Acidimicrobiales bacterium]
MKDTEPAVIDHSAQTAVSDPGIWAALFDEIPPTIGHVSRTARNLVAHYRASAHELPDHSRDDISLRWMERILATDQGRHAIPLTDDRPVDQRVQGCCRDHALVAVAALRHHGLPARSRVGFASYLSPTWHHDHVIVEVWSKGRWQRFDPELDSARPRLEDPGDLPLGPTSPFLTAARVWLGHREGSLDVTRFGVDEGLGIDGDWFVHSYVIREVAHRFGDELLLWDIWGAMHSDLTEAPPEDLALIDEIADLSLRADDGDLAAERELLSRYRDDDRLHPGSHIQSWSPYGDRYDVDLVERTTTRVGWASRAPFSPDYRSPAPNG